MACIILSCWCSVSGCSAGVVISMKQWCEVNVYWSVWTHGVFIVWNPLEDMAQIQSWPCSLAYSYGVKAVHIGPNLYFKTVSWADVPFAYSCAATSPFLQWKSLDTILINLGYWQWFLWSECVLKCVNVWCIYSVKPTWRHSTASALTSLISI